ncbi:hypothetical protein BZA77DRAFT_318381 [Pyronema omphalodes]|nr:hypothetical protein BZA77DRAFT_318381 [Pyronema omphalodes]
MSICSSPSRHFSRSPMSAPLSPQTAATTPRSSCYGDSPKFESHPRFHQSSQPLTPPPDDRRSRSPAFSSYSTHAAPQTPQDYSIDAALSPEHIALNEQMEIDAYMTSIRSVGSPVPSTYDEIFNTMPPLSPLSMLSPTSPMQHDFQLYGTPSSPMVYMSPPLSPWEQYTKATGYTGYPPASAFYGDGPIQYDNQPMDPRTYEIQQWKTRDGRSVEYSAMGLHCATM